jgi:hypothetical protein
VTPIVSTQPIYKALLLQPAALTDDACSHNVSSPLVTTTTPTTASLPPSKQPFFIMCLPIKSIASRSTAEFLTAASSKTSQYSSDHILTVSVPTFVERPVEQLEVSNLTSSDLASLKRNDAFMYYSIPTARAAAMHGEDVDPSLLRVDASTSSPSSEEETTSRKARKVSRKVTRQRRVSTECHPDLMLEELFSDPEFVAARTAMP